MAENKKPTSKKCKKEYYINRLLSSKKLTKGQEDYAVNYILGSTDSELNYWDNDKAYVFNKYSKISVGAKKIEEVLNNNKTSYIKKKAYTNGYLDILSDELDKDLDKRLSDYIKRKKEEEKIKESKKDYDKKK